MSSILTKRLAIGFVALFVAYGSLAWGAQLVMLPQTAGPIRVEKGTKLALDLETPIHSATTREGDTVFFRARNDIKVLDRMAVSRGALVKGSVILVNPAFVNGKPRRAEIQIRLDEILLVDGRGLGLKTAVLEVKEESGGRSVLSGAIQGAGQAMTGMALGGLISGSRVGMGIGAAAAVGIGIIGAVSQPRLQGSEVDLQRGAIFETKFERALDIPDVTLLEKGPVPALPSLQGNVITVASADSGTPVAGETIIGVVETAPGVSPPERIYPVDTASVAVGSPDSQPTSVGTIDAGLPDSRGALPPSASSTEGPSATPVSTAGAFTLSVDVNLVLIDAIVRDRAGKPMANLRKEDFRVFEDGVERQIQAVSRDEFPLAVALVIDRSGSVAPLMNNIQRAAYQALQQLKYGDAVCLFSFAGNVELLEPLTTDRNRVANRIGAINAGGGTNIVDAVDEALRYLERTAPDRRRAVILISDNMEGRSRTTVDQAIELALETDTVVYSVKISQGLDLFPGLPIPGIPAPRFPGLGSDPVPLITRETGGEVFDATAYALDSVLATAIARLKLRYTLSYDPVNSTRGYRRVEVRLVDRYGVPGADYTVHSRSGHYGQSVSAGGGR